MREQLINFQTAKLAKEKGFNEGSMSHYEEDGQIQHCRTSFTNGFMEDGETRFEAPTQSLLQKWLREVHNIIILVDKCNTGLLKFEHNIKSENKNEFKTYEEALEKGLQEGLKLI